MLAKEKDVEVWEDDKREKLKDIKNPLHVLRDLIRGSRRLQSRNSRPFREALWGMLIMTLSGNGERLPGDKT